MMRPHNLELPMQQNVFRIMMAYEIGTIPDPSITYALSDTPPPQISCTTLYVILIHQLLYSQLIAAELNCS